MRSLSNGATLIQKVNELPNLSGCKEIFCDFECTSFDREEKALLPFHGHRIAGIAITADQFNESWYVPIRHTDESWNLPIKPAIKWLKGILGKNNDWINHNVKFDAHFAKRDGINFGGRLIDTNVLAKLHNSDRMDHKLKPLCREWLGMEMAEEDKIKVYLKEVGSKNYGDIPADFLGAYACEDVIGNRNLYRFLCEKRPESLERVWEMEIKLTPALFDMEEYGMHVDPKEIAIEQYKSVNQQIQWNDDLVRTIDQELNCNSSNQIYDLLVNQFGLPIMGRTKKGNPSFDHEAMVAYSAHPAVLGDEKINKAIKLIGKIKKESTFQSLFLDNFVKKQVNGILYPDYNQVVRTGRMSCRGINAQQFNERAKKLIKAHDMILTCDYSQMEFRLISHYIRDRGAIKAYQDDPRTDFHQWVADECGTKRKPAKTLNFMMGFGAGKAKVTRELSANPDIVEEVARHVNKLLAAGKIKEADRNRVFKRQCHDKASKIYTIYHNRLPGIKQTSSRATSAAKNRGFVFNLYGRRRHIPLDFCYKAFNAIIQSSAADIMKESLIATAPRYNKFLKDRGIHMLATIHDSVDFEGSKESIADPEVHVHIRNLLQTINVDLSVPIIVDMGMSTVSMADANLDQNKIDFELAL